MILIPRRKGGTGTVVVPPPVTTNLRFNPGFYGFFDVAGGVTGNTHIGVGGVDLINFINSSIPAHPQYAPTDNMAGLGFCVRWMDIDKGTSGPSYDWSVVDNFAAAIRAKGKQWWLGMIPVGIGAGAVRGLTANGARCVPQWLATQYGLSACQVDAGPQGPYTKFYHPGVFAAYIAMIKAFAIRYGDPDTFCEGYVHNFGNGTALELTNNANASDYTPQKMTQASIDMFAAVRAMPECKALNFIFAADYLWNQASSTSWSGADVDWGRIMDALIVNKWGLGNANTIYNKGVYPQLPFSSTGQNTYATKTNPDFFHNLHSDDVMRGWRSATPGVGMGYRGRLLLAFESSQAEMGGQASLSGPGGLGIPPADIWLTRGPNLDNVHYMFFCINNSLTGNYGSSEVKWSTGQYPFIQSAGNTNRINPYGS